MLRRGTAARIMPIDIGGSLEPAVVHQEGYVIDAVPLIDLNEARAKFEDGPHRRERVLGRDQVGAAVTDHAGPTLFDRSLTGSAPNFSLGLMCHRAHTVRAAATRFRSFATAVSRSSMISPQSGAAISWS